jgi:hypothetical protein
LVYSAIIYYNYINLKYNEKSSNIIIVDTIIMGIEKVWGWSGRWSDSMAENNNPIY